MTGNANELNSGNIKTQKVYNTSGMGGIVNVY